MLLPTCRQILQSETGIAELANMLFSGSQGYFDAGPFNNSKNQGKAYIANQLKDLNYTYRDPESRVCFCVDRNWSHNNWFYLLDSFYF